MSIEIKINELLHAKMKNVESAARNRNTPLIISLTAEIEILEKLKRQLDNIILAVNTFGEIESTTNVDSLQAARVAPSFGHTRNMTDIGLSPKRIGAMNRLAFVKDAEEHGISLRPVKGVLFRNSNQNFVGIAYASECNPNRWWLGLPLKEYSGMVLLCENDRNKKISFVFPEKFYFQHKDHFSRDKEGGQLKFNISHHNGIYTLSMPSQNPMCINEYINVFDNLKP